MSEVSGKMQTILIQLEEEKRRLGAEVATRQAALDSVSGELGRVERALKVLNGQEEKSSGAKGGGVTRAEVVEALELARKGNENIPTPELRERVMEILREQHPERKLNGVGIHFRKLLERKESTNFPAPGRQ